MADDDRFKSLESDPIFRRIRKSKRKVKIDERFESMFTDKRFTSDSHKDKRGFKNRKTKNDLKSYYALEKEKEKQEEESEQSEKSDEEEVEDETEVSSSSDESESEAENELQDPQLLDPTNYDWKDLDDDAPKTDDTTRRLAVQNLDWDRIQVADIYTLVNSVKPPLCVTIYVSEFGKERLKEEQVRGPKEIVEMDKIDEEEEEYNRLKKKVMAHKKGGERRINEYEDADEEMDPENEMLREKIRLYQLNKMKYFYAIVDFDSVESAEAVYKELDGLEFEGTSLKLDLRFVPDEVEFDEEDVKSTCNKLPDLATYKAPMFINSALQQTKVKLTWDETDIRRQEKLRKTYTKEELEKDDFDAYLASETESEDEDDEGEDQASGENKYRKLLDEIEEEEAKNKKEDIDIEWGNFSDDEREFKKNTKRQAREGEDLEKVESFSKRKSKSKRLLGKSRNDDSSSAASSGEEDAELDLLTTEVDAPDRGEFKFNADDERFKAIYDSALYNIDPSHPKFKRTEALTEIAEKKREHKRRKN